MSCRPVTFARWYEFRRGHNHPREFRGARAAGDIWAACSPGDDCGAQQQPLRGPVAATPHGQPAVTRRCVGVHPGRQFGGVPTDGSTEAYRQRPQAAA